MAEMDGTLKLGETLDEPDPLRVLSRPPPLVLRCKIVLLGDTTVGKTSIARVFEGGMLNFPKNYNMTMGPEFLLKKVTIPETNVVVELYLRLRWLHPLPGHDEAA